MDKQLPDRRENNGKLNLKKMLRLLNKDNNFIYHDQAAKFIIKIHYKYFHLETLEQQNLLKIYWKLISEHNFKKINKENINQLHYIKKMFNFEFKRLNNIFENLQGKQLFQKDFNNIFDGQYIENIEKEPNADEINWVKRLFINWSGLGGKLMPLNKKNKKIKKIKNKNNDKNKIILKNNKKILKNKQKTLKNQQQQQQKMINEQHQNLDQIINQISKLQQQQNKNNPTNDDLIDNQIQKLQKQLLQNQTQNKYLLSKIEQNIKQQDQFYNSSIKYNQYDVKCFQWLLNNLENKQIAQSIIKIDKCQKINGEYQYLCNFQNAMNLNSHYYQEKSISKINNMREISLLKFYKTGVKSLYSYICNNKLGLIDMYQHRMNLSRFKDKNYLQSLKKMTNTNVNQEILNQVDSFDACHHCKLMYPSYLLTKCKFKSQRLSFPKIVQTQYEPCFQTYNEDKQDQNIRSSQRFLAKQNNYNCYAKINEEYICGRVYCKACLKDNYGKDWFKLNNHNCPFCLGVCNCTRCLRNQKINKLKSHYNEIGGNLTKLQQTSSFDILFQKSVQSKLKSKIRPTKTKIIHKQLPNKSKLKSTICHQRCTIKPKKVESKLLQQEQTSKSNNSQRQLLYPRKSKAHKYSYKFC